MSSKSSFHEALCEKLDSSMTTLNGPENWDEEVLGERQGTGMQVLICDTDFSVSKYQTAIRNFSGGLENLFNMLSDDHSKNTLVEVIAYRILGHKHVRLSSNNGQYWKLREKASSLPHDRHEFAPPLKGKATSFYDLSGLGLPLTAYGYPPSITHTFLCKHYTYNFADQFVGVSEGDCVIDAGACWGDTSLLFAYDSGESGRVLSFEFEESNLAVLDYVLNLNCDLAGRISVVQKALWNQSGARLSFSANGPATRVSNGEGTKQVETLSIDDLSEEVGKIDFIKMDIEGAELEALKGAENTIRKNRPKLAISLYHNLSDFVTIPAFLGSLNVRYDYYLKHPTTYDRETVLFASPK